MNFRKFNEFINRPSYTPTILTLILIILAIPVTVLISQKQQEVRLRAASTCQDQYSACISGCDSEFQQCPSVSCPGIPQTECDTRCSVLRGVCAFNCSSTYNSCLNPAPTSAPTATPSPTATPIPAVPATPTPIPTNPPAATVIPTSPTATPTPSSTQLLLNLIQEGLSATPLARTRNVTVTAVSQNNQTIGPKNGTVTYANGVFSGSLDLGVINPGLYKLAIKMGNYLYGFSTINLSGGQVSMPQTSMRAGVNAQGDIDPLPFYNEAFRPCFNSSLLSGLKSGCTSANFTDANLDGGSTVDGVDFNIFLRGLNIVIKQ